ncbi:MAG: methylated-DNA--[protein]-cysteine S-methyltransferase [Caulobacteraceae bacterium]
MAASPSLHVERLETPTGPMRLITDDEGAVRALDWESHSDRSERRLARDWGAGSERLTERAAPSPARKAVEAYFAGDIGAIETLATRTAGTEFQRAVWAALRRIPAARTTSYGELAAAIGRPRAVRAVGLANGANPIAVIVPCHRVIGASGGLTGYGGGLEAKRWLIEHERKAEAERSAVAAA